jgi:hypothetical protein
LFLRTREAGPAASKKTRGIAVFPLSNCGGSAGWPPPSVVPSRRDKVVALGQAEARGHYFLPKGMPDFPDQAVARGHPPLVSPTRTTALPQLVHSPLNSVADAGPNGASFGSITGSASARSFTKLAASGCARWRSGRVGGCARGILALPAIAAGNLLGLSGSSCSPRASQIFCTERLYGRLPIWVERLRALVLI